MDRFRTFIEEVRSRTDIDDAEPRASGRMLKVPILFHDETQPSFVVWPRTQARHEFSCIQERESCSRAADRDVAQRFGTHDGSDR